MNANEGFDDEGPFSPWVPPDDRLWRHPSETTPGAAPGAHLPSRGFRHLAPRTWTTALIAGVVGALLASGIGVATGSFYRTTVVHNYNALTSSTTRTPPASDDPTPNWTNINNQLASSMVMISGTGDAGEVQTSGMLWEEGWDQSTWGTAYVLAAGEDLSGVTSVGVAFAGGQTARGKVIGTDSLTGIAVIAVAESSLPGDMVPTFPSVEPLTGVHVGDELATVGAAGGNSGSFETGIVSSLDRSITDPDSGLVLLGMIAVAGAGPINYGTAVVDTGGAVVGLTVEASAASNSQSVSYALPMDLAANVATQIMEGHHPWHPWIGVLQAEDLPSGTANQMKVAGGAEISVVSPGSPVTEAGLVPSDVIVELANKPVVSTGELLDVLSSCSHDSWVSLRYLHKGKPVNAMIKVIAQPASPS